jgi:hypothetical protein
LWRELHAGETGADAIDTRLHAERLGPHRQVPFDELPDASFVLHEGAAKLVRGDRLVEWTPAGYARHSARPRSTAVVITPPSLVALLRAGWEPSVPLLHQSAVWS